MSEAPGSLDRLAIEQISKTFPGQRALDQVSIALRPGEVRGLLGANGSGKSTLVKILAGVHAPDSGSGGIAIDGEQLPLPVVPSRLPDLGMCFVHQDLGLVERRPVLENLTYGRPFLRNRIGLIDWRRERERATALLERFDASFGLDDLVATLSRAQQAMVAIMRAFDLGGERMRVLVLDEPTVGLPPAGVDQLLETVRSVAASGVSVVYVSHALDEVERMCDTVSVLRDGRVILDAATAELDRDAIVEAITGHVPAAAGADHEELASAAQDGAAALDVRGLVTNTLRGIDIQVRRGEIVGVVGDLDSGANEVLPGIYGDLGAEHAVLAVGGNPIERHSPRGLRLAGAGYVPGDRAGSGLLSGLTVRENITCADLREFSVGPLLHRRRERSLALRLIEAFGIRPAWTENRIETLSGGNQQKAVLARWLHGGPPVLLIDEPTQGVDIGAKADIHREIHAGAAGGSAFLIHSSELDELVDLCDRVIVLQRGRAVRSLGGERLSVAEIRHAMFEREMSAA
jgi:ribose transport system ATP-binding protein